MRYTASRVSLIVAFGVLVGLSSRSVFAWSIAGHQSTARMAVRLLPADFPEFFRMGQSAVAHSVIDPDVIKLRTLLQLRNREYPEHYLDWEMFGGRDFPATRYEYIARLHQLNQKPASTGFLPYAIVENFQELMLAFAEHRRWPDNLHVRSKILILAGHLAHYAGDLCQPLHTTIHHNGRAKRGAESPNTGIHFAVDGLFESTSIGHSVVGIHLAPLASGNLLTEVQRQFEGSFRLVDRVYELEADLRAAHEGGEPTAQLIAFAKERQHCTISFISGLFQSAWIDSASLQLPVWLEREIGTGF
ncbi:MAG: hypothetical protein V3S30_07175 [Thermoanaerobaculia bacterium]